MRIHVLLGLALPAFATACGEVAGDREVVCGDAPIEVLPNANFDDADPVWRQDPVTPAILCGSPQILPDTGAVAACFGGVDGLVQSLTQTVPLPAGATSATLSGKICIDTAETMAADLDELVFDLLDGGTPIGSFGKRTNQNGMAGCAFAVFSLDAALSKDPIEATFRMRSTLNAAMPTSFYVDTLSLQVSCSQ